MAIKKFRHKGLKKFFVDGTKAGIPTAYVPKIGLILDLLDAAVVVEDMNFPGSDFHALKGNLKGYYSVHVNGNWTIIFQFENGDAFDVDFIDYH